MIPSGHTLSHPLATCGAEHPSGNYWCTLAVHGDDEPHRCVYQGRELARWHEPTPEPPKWRQLVDDTAHCLLDQFKEPSLPAVLRCLTAIAEGEDPEDYLAEIIAVCEQQVGDGWQAEPHRSADTGLCTAWELIAGARIPILVNEDWRTLGDASARWLAHLTGEAS